MKEKHLNIYGTTGISYSPRIRKRCTTEDLGEYLKRFQLNSALLLIGRVSSYIFEKNNPLFFYDEHGLPVTEYALAYIAMLLIKRSNDFRQKIMSEDDLFKACDMYHSMKDLFEYDKDRIGFMIRTAAVQFDYQREMRNVTPRILLIFRDFWQLNPNSNRIDISNTIKEITGLGIEEIVALGFAFLDKSKNGFVRLYETSVNEKQRFSEMVDKEKQKKFINWISCDYEKFRNEYETSNVTEEIYDKSRFNPLFKYPVIIPDRNPMVEIPNLSIVPIPRLLFRKITEGLYFDLSVFYKKSSKSNDFRQAFGYVFQYYIGRLLENCIVGSNIVGDQEYADSTKATPDWIIINDNRAILIEVKQSSLFLNSRTYGSSEQIQDDLKKTIAKGVGQLWLFEENLKSRKYGELDFLKNITAFERLIITYNKSYFANSLIRYEVKKVLKRSNPKIHYNYHWHTISVEEFEYLIGIKNIDLFDFLETKRLKPEDDEKDFREYLYEKKQKEDYVNEYLDKVASDYFQEIGA